MDSLNLNNIAPKSGKAGEEGIKDSSTSVFPSELQGQKIRVGFFHKGEIREVDPINDFPYWGIYTIELSEVKDQ